MGRERRQSVAANDLQKLRNKDTEIKDVAAPAVKACYVPEMHIARISRTITYCFCDLFLRVSEMKIQKGLFAALVAAVLLVSASAMAVDGTPSAPTSIGGVVPYIIPGANPGGNRTCAEVGFVFFGNATYYQCWSAKRDPGDFGLGFEDISGNELCDRNLIIASNDGTFVQFTAGPDGVGAAILKGGSGGGNAYVYEPQALSDSGLASPLNPSGYPAALSHVDGFCWNPVTNDPGPGIGCYENETAWATGTRYVAKGNWATYTPYANQPKTVVLFAGQTMDAGDVSFSAPHDGVVTITVELNTGWRFALNPVGDDNGTPIFDNNLKVQDYTGKPAAKNPAPGLFGWKTFAEGQYGQIDVPFGTYYGVHVDVEREVDCPIF
jgi:hypothetical protein